MYCWIVIAARKLQNFAAGAYRFAGAVRVFHAGARSISQQFETKRSRRAQSTPSPPSGGGPGGGGRGGGGVRPAVRGLCLPPLPTPPPQGGREQTCAGGGNGLSALPPRSI